jgi:alpha-1,3-glucan synthase
MAKAVQQVKCLFTHMTLSGRGRASDQWLKQPSYDTNASDHEFVRPLSSSPLDSVAFHYSVYRALIPFLGLDGNPFPEYDIVGWSFADMWNAMAR